MMGQLIGRKGRAARATCHPPRPKPCRSGALKSLAIEEVRAGVREASLTGMNHPLAHALAYQRSGRVGVASIVLERAPSGRENLRRQQAKGHPQLMLLQLGSVLRFPGIARLTPELQGRAAIMSRKAEA